MAKQKPAARATSDGQAENALRSRFRSITIKDVAQRAGVSRITAARILSGNPNYPASPETVEKVRNAAREMNYQPNPFAQSLGRRRSHIVGLCVHQDATVGERVSHSEYLVHLDPHIAGIHSHPEAARYSVMVIRRDDADPELEANLRQKLRYLDGLIYVTPRQLHLPILTRIADSMPLVLENAPDVKGINTVSVDEHGIIADAVRLLVQRGCRKLGLITWGAQDICANVSRSRAFRKALKSLGLPLSDEQVALGNSRFQTRGVMRDMLQRVPDLDGIIVPRDSALSNAIEELRLCGRQVGRDLAIISIVETSLCSLLQPSITAINFPFDLLANRAFDLLLQTIEGKLTRSKRLLIPAVINERDSTRLFSEARARRLVAT